MLLYATQYADGGNFQWGGRFLTPLIVPSASVAAAGLQRLVAGRVAPRRRPLAGSLVALALLISVGGVARSAPAASSSRSCTRRSPRRPRR